MVKGFLVAGTNSGCGKTLVTLGLLRYFLKKGLNVQPFKVGPDYIDSQWHKIACKKSSVNLDLFSMRNGIKSLFLKYAKNADISIIEGVMGIFDGKYSTFNLAKMLKIPVLLVIDTFGIAETISILLKGFKERFKRAGLELYIVLNRVSSERHLLRLLKSLKKYNVIGYIFRRKEFEIPSRHLGLFLPSYYNKREEFLDCISEEIKENFNTELLKNLKINLKQEGISFSSGISKIPFNSIGIAYDDAFNFYYTHILDELKETKKIYFFSPLRDKYLPDFLDILYIGGGYPELFAEKLCENKEMLKLIKDWAESRKPVYAECGGLVYLSKFLILNGRRYKMADIFPFEIEKRRLTLGFREVKIKKKNQIFPSGTTIKGHEFHYTDIINNLDKVKKIYRVKTVEGGKFEEGYLYKNTLATYIHLIKAE